MKVIFESLPLIFNGLLYTILMAVLSLLLGFMIGSLLGIGRFYGNRIINFVAVVYSRIIRSIPTVVMVMMLYLVIQNFVDLNPVNSVVIALGIHSGAYQAEIIRGALGSVARGEILAARTLGMTGFQTFRKVVFPQMIINSIPGWTNEVAVVLKETSIGYVIGATEMLRQASYIASVERNYLQMYLLVGFIYLILTVFSAKALEKLDDYFKHRGVKEDRKSKGKLLEI